MRTTILFLSIYATLALTWGCSSSDGDKTDAGGVRDTGVQQDQTTPQPDSTPPGDEGVPESDQGAGVSGQLALEMWEMNTAAGAKNMFDYNQKTGEEGAGWSFEPISGVTEAAIILTEYDGGWYAYGYRGPFIYQVIAQTAGDKDAFKADVIAFIEYLAGKLPDANEGKKVEEYVPAPGEVGGWIEDDQVGKPGVEAGYDYQTILDIIDGHHQAYENEGCAGFAKEDYMK